MTEERNIDARVSWSQGLLSLSFWGLKGGLASMMASRLIPWKIKEQDICGVMRLCE